MSSLRVGWIQPDTTWENPQANIEYIDRLLDQQATEVWVLPEMWSTGFSMEVERAEDEGGPSLQAMRRWAREQQALIIGSVKVRLPGEPQGRNRAYGVYPDGSYTYYDKRHLFRMAQEHLYYIPGTQQSVWIWKGWRIAVQVCYDLRFPVWARRSPTYDYELLIYVANWPAPRHEAWQKLLPARAIENQAYVLGVNRIGQDGKGHSYQGGSSLWSFKGEKLLHSGAAEGAFVAEIHQEALHAFRAQFPAHLDADFFTILPSTT
ncbi:MAG: amidohydrolase [Bacteroidia bacterium]|nr:amidohydrolase [Bacteroidia bacterium]MDW8236323.1 amidohydrolase [Bacteroidia bacterium]